MALSCAADSYVCSQAEGIEVETNPHIYHSTRSPTNNLQFTVTQGPTVYEINYSTSTLGGQVAISESCDLDGPSGSFTQAVCTVSFMVSAGGSKTASSTQTTVSGTGYDFQYAQIPITAGAEKLPTGSATCTDTSTGGAAAPTGIVRKDIYKVIVPVGAALAAGALM